MRSSSGARRLMSSIENFRGLAQSPSTETVQGEVRFDTAGPLEGVGAAALLDALQVRIETATQRLTPGQTRAIEVGGVLQRLQMEIFLGRLGTYLQGSIEVVVSRRGEEELVVSVMGGAATALTPVRGTVFALDGSRVEFVDGSLRTDFGTFAKQSG